MTPDDIIRMARKAGFNTEREMIWVDGLEISPYMQRFAALVAAAEREACAKVVEELPMYGPDDETADWYGLAQVDCAAAIRARGQQ